MNNPRQVYGYIVCLIAIIGFLISAPYVIRALVDLNDPMRASDNHPELASFEIYQLEALRKLGLTPYEAELRAETVDFRNLFETARAEKIQTLRHRAYRNIFAYGLVVCVSIILFITHYLSVRRI